VDVMVQATGLAVLAQESYSKYVQAEHEKKYGKPEQKK